MMEMSQKFMDQESFCPVEKLDFEYKAIQLFEERVKSNPEAIALEHIGQQMTYRELNQRANQLAHYLKTQGVVPEQIIAIALERSFEVVIAALAVFKVGGACLPLDIEYPFARLQFMLDDTKAPLLLTSSSYLKIFSYYKGKLICFDQEQDNLKMFPSTNPANFGGLSNLAYIIYTSGSTGKPKGVLIEQRGLSNLALNQAKMFGIHSRSRILQFSSLSFDAAVSELFVTLIQGACLVIPPIGIKLIGQELQEVIQKYKITGLTLSPSIMATLDEKYLSSLELVVSAGESGSAELFQKWSKKVRLVNAYGPTEATVCASMKVFSKGDSARNIGRALPNVKMFILNNDLSPLPANTVGELYIGGIGVARAYLNQPELTKEKFIPNPFATQEDEKRGSKFLYKTGDLARYLHNGDIEYVGRADDQVKLRGQRIELGEIESYLQKHPNVKDAIVILSEDEPEQKRLIAYILYQQKPLTAEKKRKMVVALRKSLRTQLPEYMIPSAFVLLENWPLSLNNKLDRKALPKPEETAFVSTEYIAPAGDIEVRLVSIWEKVLGVSKIGVNDNFFELGGTSFLVIQLASELHTTLGLKIAPRYLYETATVRTLGTRIEELTKANETHFVRSINFFQEIQLEPQVTATKTQAVNIEDPKHILLTGATGYSGALLLHELLQQTKSKIYCLIRGDDEEHAKSRLQQNLLKYALPPIRNDGRVMAIPGNISQPYFGLEKKVYDKLARTIDTIYHSAAEVNFLKSYEALKPTNVIGTQNILYFAVMQKLKAVHYLSTAAVFSLLSYFKNVKIHKENDDLSESAPYLHLDLGYTQSKWVAEQIVSLGKSRNIPITIFRTGFLLCHGQSGAANTSDFWSRFVHGCINMGCFPDLNIKEELIQAEYAIQAIVHISKQSHSIGKAFHIVPRPEANISIAGFFNKVNALGYSLQKLPYNEWKEQVIKYIKRAPESPIAGLQPFFTEIVYDNCSLLELYKNSPEIDDENTQRSLVGTNIQPHEITTELLNKYLSYLKSIGYL